MSGPNASDQGLPDDVGDLEQDFPSLWAACLVIRGIRSPAYFRRWDRFTEAWRRVLRFPPSVGVLAGSNLGTAADTLFERADSHAQLENLRLWLQSLTHLPTAVEYLNAPPSGDPLSLKEATGLHVAFLTAAGYERLSEAASGGGALADRWLAWWQEVFAIQNAQQVEYSLAALAPDEYPDLRLSFAEAVEVYLQRFGRTDAASASMAAVFPFSPFADEKLLSGLSELLPHIAFFIRLVSDQSLDLSEKLNAGLFAVAAERGLSIAGVRERIRSGEFLAGEIEERIRALVESRQLALRHTLETILPAYRGSTAGRVLADFVEAVFAGVAANT